MGTLAATGSGRGSGRSRPHVVQRSRSPAQKRVGYISPRARRAGWRRWFWATPTMTAGWMCSSAGPGRARPASRARHTGSGPGERWPRSGRWTRPMDWRLTRSRWRTRRARAGTRRWCGLQVTARPARRSSRRGRGSREICGTYPYPSESPGGDDLEWVKSGESGSSQRTEWPVLENRRRGTRAESRIWKQAIGGDGEGEDEPPGTDPSSRGRLS